MGEFESAWESAGGRAAPSLDSVSAAIVIGDDPVATACVALGIGRVQALRRRVAVGDLIGEAAPLQGLVQGDDPHGISDSFLYGVSLNKIARQVDRVGNLYVLPSGSESVLQEEILSSDRWRRLAAGFREVDALLLLAAPASVPGLEHLIGMTEGVVLVGAATNPAPSAPVLAEVRTATRRPAADAVASARAATPPPPPPRRRGWLVAVLVLLVAAIAAAVFLARGPIMALVSGSGRAAAPMQADSVRRADSLVAARAAADSAAGADSLARADSIAAADTTELAPANPADSARASAFAVEMRLANTRDGALASMRELAFNIPAITVSPVVLDTDRSQWYKVIAGAFRTRRQADSLLQVLRSTRRIETGGVVVRAPLALALGGAMSRDAAAALVSSYIARGVPAYALVHPNGTSRVLAGAFERPEQAELLASSLKSANIEATLVYRVGSAF